MYYARISLLDYMIYLIFYFQKHHMKANETMLTKRDRRYFT